MANSKPINTSTAAKKVVPVAPAEGLSLEDQVAALKAQLAEAEKTNEELLEHNNNAGHRSVVRNKVTLPDGTIKVDY